MCGAPISFCGHELTSFAFRLRKRMNEPPFVHGGVSPCVSCQRPIDYHTWRELKYKIIIEMDVRPLGDTIINEGLQDWPEATACWQVRACGCFAKRVLIYC